MEILQSELRRCAIEWNQHKVRESNQAEAPGGKPDLLFFMPGIYGEVIGGLQTLHFWSGMFF